MAVEKKHHFSLHKKEQKTVIHVEVNYTKKQTTVIEKGKKKRTTVIEEGKKKQTTVIEEKHHKHVEIHGGLGAAAAAGAYALPEKHQAKKNPENAHKHRIAKQVVAVAAVGAVGFAFHERHVKKHVKKL